MKFIIDRETLLKPLQAIQGVVERRQTLPILSNVLMSVGEDTLAVTATDMEVELVAKTGLKGAENGEITLPARKLIDICRALPPEASISFSVDGERAAIRSGRSRFTLSTLPASEYPSADRPADEASISIKQGAFKHLIELTHFAMAHQDVRYYLNGLLLELSSEMLRAVATDGHRLAVGEMDIEADVGEETRSLILPRKGVGELLRLLGGDDETMELVIGSNAVRASFAELQFTSKLIDGRFPDYERVIPDSETCDKQITLDKETLRQCLARAAILSNDKYRAVRLSLAPGILRVVANNPEQEEAEDEMEVAYDGDSLEVGFNVTYLMDALNALPSANARLYFTDASSSCLIMPEGKERCRYVVMPMRL
ncbi:MAG: DNA polymerase III subunit beta [Gammaproteobacteria bacterium]|nr:DNA polymerase III subunit beta [Gammaproteobacteria bacterium]MDH3411096.1 DNA polymerase III subunit beta [Gammaproteobacteria bacterium]